jgi:hypothetical protein
LPVVVRKGEGQFLTLREEGMGVLRKIFEPNREDVTVVLEKTTPWRAS